MTTEAPLEGKRILVLEDDFYLATDEKGLLERAGRPWSDPLEAHSRSETS